MRIVMVVVEIFAAAWLLAGCQKSESGTFLGSAVVEVETYQVPALEQGPLIAVLKDEGDSVSVGERIAWVDTVPYALQLSEAAAGMEGLNANLASNSSDILSLRANARGLEKDAARIQPLSQVGAATPQQWDQISSGKDAAMYRLEAARHSTRGLDAQRKALRYRLDFLNNQLQRCRIESPVSGIVLTRYRNPGEAVSPGQSVFEIGRRDSVHVDFFVPQIALSALRLGDTVRLRIEGETSAQVQHVPAVISFISSEAEFTPKNIQTRESRAELVFRVRAEAASGHGMLKRGLPVEVWR